MLWFSQLFFHRCVGIIVEEFLLCRDVDDAVRNVVSLGSRADVKRIAAQAIVESCIAHDKSESDREVALELLAALQLRRVVLPAWRELDPKLDDRVLALAADCRRIATGLATIGDEALERVQQGGTLCLDTLAGLEPLAREQALREWPRRHGLQPMPGGTDPARAR